MTSQSAPASLRARLAPAEKLFFTWLARVFLAATLVACAWIDDAPPLDLASFVIAIYVVVRVLAEFPNFMAVAPFHHRGLQAVTASLAIGLLGLSFLALVTFVERLALSVA